MFKLILNYVLRLNNQDITTKVPSDYNTKVSDFQKLLFVKAFAPYLLVQSITYFVAEQLGKKFVESPSVELPSSLSRYVKSYSISFYFKYWFRSYVKFYEICCRNEYVK